MLENGAQTMARIVGGKAADRLTFDGRSRAGRVMRSTIDGLLADLGRAPSTAERRLIETAALLILKRETMQGDMANGRPVNPLDLVAVSGAIMRNLRELGIGARDYHGRARKAAGPAAVPLRERLAAEAEQGA